MDKKKPKKKDLTMAEVSAGYEKFIKGKELTNEELRIRTEELLKNKKVYDITEDEFDKAVWAMLIPNKAIKQPSLK